MTGYFLPVASFSMSAVVMYHCSGAPFPSGGIVKYGFWPFADVMSFLKCSRCNVSGSEASCLALGFVVGQCGADEKKREIESIVSLIEKLWGKQTQTDYGLRYLSTDLRILRMHLVKSC